MKYKKEKEAVTFRKVHGPTLLNWASISPRSGRLSVMGEQNDTITEGTDYDQVSSC